MHHQNLINMTTEKLKSILDDHALWVQGNNKGKHANLQGANLREANLREANLRGADLEKANLEKADLESAYLNFANLDGTNLRGAKNVFIFNKLSGRICYAVVFENSFRIKAGCFWDTLEVFEEACFEKYKDDETKNYAIQIAYLKMLSKSIYKSSNI